jgi:hypothetical protein
MSMCVQQDKPGLENAHRSECIRDMSHNGQLADNTDHTNTTST